MAGHRTTSMKMPLLVLAALFAFTFVIRAIEDIPNPGYAERTGFVAITVEPGASGTTIQLRSRCGPEVVDTYTLSDADWAKGPADRQLELSDAGDCVVGVRQLPSSDDFQEVPVAGVCRVAQSPTLVVSCS